MKTFISLTVIYTIIILVHLLLLKMKEIENMKKEINKFQKRKKPIINLDDNKVGKEIKETFDEYDETSMKKDLLSFINDPKPSTLSVDQIQSVDDIYRQSEISDEVLQRTEPIVKDNRILAIDTLSYENDKEINTGIIEDGLMAFDSMDMGFSSF